MFFSNTVPKMHRFWDIRLQKWRYLENRVRGPSRSLDSVSRTNADLQGLSNKDKGNNWQQSLVFYGETHATSSVSQRSHLASAAQRSVIVSCQYLPGRQKSIKERAAAAQLPVASGTRRLLARRGPSLHIFAHLRRRRWQMNNMVLFQRRSQSQLGCSAGGRTVT